MLRLERHDDVTRLAFASRIGRLVGYSASAYLVARAGRAGDPRPVLVDTAFPRAADALLDVLRALHAGRGPGEALAGAIVTHAHEDHAGNAALLARHGVPLAMGDATRAAIAALPRLALYRRATWGRMAPLHDALPFDAGGLALLATPGHSPDHHAVWDAETGTLFGGDLFLGVKVRIAHRWEDPRALARSLRAMAALRPRRLFDAHRGLVPDPVRALEAKAGWVEDTVAEVDRLLDAGWPAARVRVAVLGREELTGWVSAGAYSRRNFVRAVADTRALPPRSAQGSTAKRRSASRS